jgi:hypothetical protein
MMVEKDFKAELILGVRLRRGRADWRLERRIDRAFAELDPAYILQAKLLHRWTDRALREQFDIYNRKYWGGELPPCPVKRSDIRPYDSRKGASDPKGGITIYVKCHHSHADLRQTLLHEMCHHAAGPESRAPRRKGGTGGTRQAFLRDRSGDNASDKHRRRARRLHGCKTDKASSVGFEAHMQTDLDKHNGGS